MDRQDIAPSLLFDEFKILENANRRLGGQQLALASVQRLLNRTQPKSLSILDLATGAADIPRAITSWARQRKMQVTITAVDHNPQVLKMARESCRDWPEIILKQHDLRDLPYAAESFDLVLCSLALHHFSAADAVLILRRIREIARLGCAVNDLRRNRTAIWMTGLLTPMLTKNRSFRHDAMLSCRAAFTVKELQLMAEEAGWSNFQIKRHHLFFRMVLEGKK